MSSCARSNALLIVGDDGVLRTVCHTASGQYVAVKVARTDVEAGLVGKQDELSSRIAALHTQTVGEVCE